MTASDDASELYSFYPFSTSTLNDILGKFSELSLKNIILGYMFMVRTFFLLLIHYLFLFYYNFFGFHPTLFSFIIFS